jgi:hypothetical protein
MTFSQTTGSRAQVWHGTAKKTAGGLTKSHLMMNKHGRIVSRKQHSRGKTAIKRLFKLFITSWIMSFLIKTKLNLSTS